MGYSCEDIQLAINVLPSDTLFECLKERVADLGDKSVSLFKSAVKRPKSDLIEYYLRPNLFSPGNSYSYIAEDKGGKDPSGLQAVLKKKTTPTGQRWGYKNDCCSSYNEPSNIKQE